MEMESEIVPLSASQAQEVHQVQAMIAGLQEVLDDERGNAFSIFVHAEMCRVFHATPAIHVPGF